MRHLYTFEPVDGITIKIYRKPSTDEYVVRFFRDDVHLSTWDYFTSDRDDAFRTASYQLRKFRESENTSKGSQLL